MHKVPENMNSLIIFWFSNILDSIIDNCVQIAMHPNFTVHACDPIL
jgi:hypothetical protein